MLTLRSVSDIKLIFNKNVRGHQKTMQSSGWMMQFFGIMCICKCSLHKAYLKHNDILAHIYIHIYMKTKL